MTGRKGKESEGRTLHKNCTKLIHYVVYLSLQRFETPYHSLYFCLTDMYTWIACTVIYSSVAPKISPRGWAQQKYPFLPIINTTPLCNINTRVSQPDYAPLLLPYTLLTNLLFWTLIKYLNHKSCFTHSTSPVAQEAGVERGNGTYSESGEVNIIWPPLFLTN